MKNELKQKMFSDYLSEEVLCDPVYQKTIEFLDSYYNKPFTPRAARYFTHNGEFYRVSLGNSLHGNSYNDIESDQCSLYHDARNLSKALESLLEIYDYYGNEVASDISFPMVLIRIIEHLAGSISDNLRGISGEVRYLDEDRCGYNESEIRKLLNELLKCLERTINMSINDLNTIDRQQLLLNIWTLCFKVHDFLIGIEEARDYLVDIIDRSVPSMFNDQQETTNIELQLVNSNLIIKAKHSLEIILKQQKYPINCHEIKEILLHVIYILCESIKPKQCPKPWYRSYKDILSQKENVEDTISYLDFSISLLEKGESLPSWQIDDSFFPS